MNYYCSISEILDYWVQRSVYDIDRVSIFCPYLSLIVLSVDPSARYLFKTFSDYQKNQKKTWFFRIDSLTQGKITEKLPFLCKSSLVWLNPLTFTVFIIFMKFENQNLIYLLLLVQLLVDYLKRKHIFRSAWCCSHRKHVT